MALTDFFANVVIRGYSEDDEDTIRDALTRLYTDSETARTTFDQVADLDEATLSIEYREDSANATRFADITVGDPPASVELDLDYIGSNSFISSTGTAVPFSVSGVLAHEFGHGLLATRDLSTEDIKEPPVDYVGDTVRYTNTIRAELGETQRLTYTGSGVEPTLTAGTEYSQGERIDVARVGDDIINTSNDGRVTKDVLIGEIPLPDETSPSEDATHTLIAGGGRDFLYGMTGADTLNGGSGDDFLDGGAGDDRALFSGDFSEYNISSSITGGVRIAHARPNGGTDDGVDILENVETATFADGTQLDLTDGTTSGAGQDLAFVIDTTSSMADDIAAVRAQAADIIDEVFSAGRDLENSRIAVVGYNDPGTSTILPFTNQESTGARKVAAQDAIDSISVRGGGDIPEVVYSGLLRALDGSAGDWREDASARKIVLFGDAPPKDSALASQVNALAANVNAEVETGTPEPVPLIAPSSVSTTSLTSDVSMTTFAAREVDVEESTGSDEVVPVQLFTVAIGAYPPTLASFEQIAEEGGGSSFDAAGSSEIVDALLDVVSLPIYTISGETSAIDEGDSGSSTVEFTIARDVAENAASVTLGQSGTADNADVSDVPSSVSFAEGETENTVSVTVNGDEEFEEDETFSLNISSVSEEATFGSEPITLTIANDDDEAPAVNEVRGTDGRDNLRGTDGPDQMISLGGSYDRMAGSAGSDEFIFGAEAANGVRERDVISNFDVAEDSIVLRDGASIAESREQSDTVVLSLDDGNDVAYVRGDGVSLDTVNIVDENLLV